MSCFGNRERVYAEGTFRNIQMSQRQEVRDANRRQFCSNIVRTSKYSAMSFLPLNLITQFSKASNAFFLLLSYMQTIRSISISNGVPMMAAPLAFVVFISMIKDAYEDYKRHKSDDSENKKQANVLINGQLEKVYWQDVRPGQLLRVDDEEFFPADMVLLKSSE